MLLNALQNRLEDFFKKRAVPGLVPTPQLATHHSLTTVQVSFSPLTYALCQAGLQAKYTPTP